MELHFDETTMRRFKEGKQHAIVLYAIKNMKHREPITIREPWAEVQGQFIYKADYPEDRYDEVAWKPSILMNGMRVRAVLIPTSLTQMRMNQLSEAMIHDLGFETLEEFTSFWNMNLPKARRVEFEADANPVIYYVTVDFHLGARP